MENLQKLNNLDPNYKKGIDCNLISTILNTNDEILIAKLNSKICNTNMMRINLMEYLLLSDKIKQHDFKTIIDFFNRIKSYFLLHQFSGANFKKINDGKNLIIQFSTFKANYCSSKYIVDRIEQLLNRSGIKYKFFRLTNRRFSKTIDLLFVI